MANSESPKPWQKAGTQSTELGVLGVTLEIRRPNFSRQRLPLRSVFPMLLSYFVAPLARLATSAPLNAALSRQLCLRFLPLAVSTKSKCCHHHVPLGKRSLPRSPSDSIPDINQPWQ